MRFADSVSISPGIDSRRDSTTYLKAEQDSSYGCTKGHRDA